MIEKVSINGSPDITGYLKEVEFTKDSVTYWGNLYWERDHGFNFFPDDEDKDPDLTYEEMLLIDEQTNTEGE